MLIDLGLSHFQATSLLIVVNIVFMLIVFAFQEIGALLLMGLIFVMASGLTMLLKRIIARKEGNEKEAMIMEN